MVCDIRSKTCLILIELLKNKGMFNNYIYNRWARGKANGKFDMDDTVGKCIIMFNNHTLPAMACKEVLS